MTYTTATEAAKAYAQQNPSLTTYPDEGITLTEKDTAEILNDRKILWETETGNLMFMAIQDNLRNALEHDVEEWCNNQRDIDFDELEIYPEDIAEEAWDMYCGTGEITSNDEIEIIENSPNVNLVAFLNEDNSQGNDDRSEEAVKQLHEQLPFNVKYDELYYAVQNVPSDFRDIWVVMSVPLKDFTSDWRSITVENPTLYIGNALMGGYFDFQADDTILVDRDDVLASIAWIDEYSSSEATVH